MLALDLTTDLWRTLAFAVVSWQPLARPFMFIGIHGTSDLVEAVIGLCLSRFVRGLPRVGCRSLLIGECAFCSKDSLAGVLPYAKKLMLLGHGCHKPWYSSSAWLLAARLFVSAPDQRLSLGVQRGLTFLCAACALATDFTQLLHTHRPLNRVLSSLLWPPDPSATLETSSGSPISAVPLGSAQNPSL